jgi:Rps23 Pro-64 3,4-dihydroxylase Tpa1-like proline 4-hydroxylase
VMKRRTECPMLMRPIDRDALRKDYTSARPFPFVKIETFLEPAFAEEVAAAYPSFEEASGRGFTFNAVNERKKVQITDTKLFPEKVARLSEALASPAFLQDLSYVTGIPDLLADEELSGGGMHITGPGGRLDVHVDFNYLERRKLHRRLNLLLYLNPVWEGKWGGHIQLWDKDVKTCQQDLEPILNRCVIFETSETSFHGVTPVTNVAPFPRISFAAYFYTREPPLNWKGTVHSTIFKARPDERLREYVLMPAERLQHQLTDGVRRIKRGIKSLISAER